MSGSEGANATALVNAPAGSPTVAAVQSVPPFVERTTELVTPARTTWGLPGELVSAITWWPGSVGKFVNVQLLPPSMELAIRKSSDASRRPGEPSCASTAGTCSEV